MDDLCKNKTIQKNSFENVSNTSEPKIENAPKSTIGDTSKKKRPEKLSLTEKQLKIKLRRKTPEYLKKEKEYRLAHKNEINERAREYNRKNRERRLLYAKEYRRKNRKKISLYSKKYRDSHKNEKRAYNHKNRKRFSLNCKKYYSKNKKQISLQTKKYAKNNPKQTLLYKKKWRDNNKDQIRKHQEYLYKNDIKFRLKSVLRARLRSAIANNCKTGSAVRDLGCTIEDFRKYLSSKFQSGMSWENYGKWHIDHIKPLSLFNLNVREQLLQACHYTNMQPLWASDNLSKSNKLNHST